MTDIMNDAQTKFKNIITDDIDMLFSQTLSDEEINFATIEEVGSMLSDATMAIDMSSQITQDALDAIANVEYIENELLNLEKMHQIKSSIQRS